MLLYILHIAAHLFLTSVLWQPSYYSYFTDEETKGRRFKPVSKDTVNGREEIETQRGLCPKPDSWPQCFMAVWLVIKVFYESGLANTSEEGKHTLIFQNNWKSHRQSKLELELESNVFIFKFKYQRHLGKLAIYPWENVHTKKHFPFSLLQITWQWGTVMWPPR